jgi:hypothetical protein
MAKFLQSKVEQGLATEVYDSNLLTTAGIRSLIPGNFYITKVLPRENTPLAGSHPCFLLFHEKALFVLLQCHQSGIIHGDEREEQWTCFNYLGDGRPFANPVLQNQKNIDLFAALLKLPPQAFYSCILFDNECELRRVPGNVESRSILWVDQLETHFATLLPKLELRYSHTQLEALHDIFVLVSGEQ